MSINGITRALSLLDSIASEAAPRSPNQPLPTPPTFDSGAASRLGEQAFAGAMQAHKLRALYAAQQTAAPPQTAKPQPTLEIYRRQATQILGTAVQADALTRNRAISGAYANLYVKNPEAFRWVGAAAHASGQVGLAIETTRATEAVRVAFAGDDAAAQEAAMNKLSAVFPMSVSESIAGIAKSNPIQGFKLLAEVSKRAPDANYSAMDLALSAFGWDMAVLTTMVEATGNRAPQIETVLGDGNKAIFENIYPVALAYQQGGISELRRLNTKVIASGDDRQRQMFEPLVKAFEDIDAGIKLKAQGQAAAGEALIREGNRKLIVHEQEAIAQPVAFDKYPESSFLMSPLAFGDFDADPTKIDKQTVSYFWFKTEKAIEASGFTSFAPPRMQEVDVAIPTHFMKSIGDKDARIGWIINEIFPKWL